MRSSAPKDRDDGRHDVDQDHQDFSEHRDDLHGGAGGRTGDRHRQRRMRRQRRERIGHVAEPRSEFCDCGDHQDRADDHEHAGRGKQDGDDETVIDGSHPLSRLLRRMSDGEAP